MVFILDCLFQRSTTYDFCVMIACLVSSLIGFLLPRTKDVFIGETYGKNNPVVNVIRVCTRLVWFLSSFFLLFRSVVVGLRKFSFAYFFFYILVVVLSLIPVLVFAPLIEKKWQKKHRSEALDIAFSNPIFKKIHEIWKADGDFRAIYILSDRAVFLRTGISSSSLGIVTSEKVDPNILIKSNSDAYSVVNAKAKRWKSDWQTRFITFHQNEFSLLYSSLGYDNASDLTMEQLANALAEVLKLEMGTIKGEFKLDITYSHSYFAGMGETLHQKHDVENYHQNITVTAANVVYYKMERPIDSETPNTNHLKKW